MYFFFYKQNTAYEWRISDWDSDGCSSDLSAITRLNESRGRSGSGRCRLPPSGQTGGIMLRRGKPEVWARAGAMRWWQSAAMLGYRMVVRATLCRGHYPPASPRRIDRKSDGAGRSVAVLFGLGGRMYL